MKNKALYNWLETEWKLSNHPKYQHFFKQWIINITQSQIEGYEKQRTTELTQ
jgi:hypothetical protein